MNHIIDKLESWLADELSSEDRAVVEEHLAVCSECASRAQELREVWNLLGAMEENESPETGIWQAVRARTIAVEEKNEAPQWFFGGGQALRAGLAATAMAAGLSLAFILPAGQQVGGTVNIATGSDSVSDMQWLEESSLFGTDNGGFLDDLWLGSGLENEGGGS